MNLLEFQAKKLLAVNGIRVPQGRRIECLADLEEMDFPAFLKAQIPVGGRGKAGVVQMAANRKEAVAVAADLLGREVKGYTIRTLTAEAALSIQREIYIACFNDKNGNRPMFMISPQGGMDIEPLVRDIPHQLIRRPIDPLMGIMDFEIRHMAAGLDLEYSREFAAVVQGMWHILRYEDATLVEINPLALTDDGRVVAVDAKIILDDNAAFRHADLRSDVETGQKGLVIKNESRAERLARRYQMSYVLMDGDIGIIADGAGTGMLTLDLVSDMGGRRANFCEMGGRAAAEGAEQAMEIVLANPSVTALIISLIGGMTRMDEVAAGIDAYLRKNDCNVPIAVRMCGTGADAGGRILAAHGLKIHNDLWETVAQAVKRR